VAPPAPAPTAPPESSESSGDREAEIARLVALRRSEPRDAAHAAALAGLYFDKRWWGPGIAAFRAAIKLDHARREDAALIAHTVSALGSDRAERDAETLLRELGAAAKAPVREAARTHPSPTVRKRAAALLRRWECRSFFCF
jgi:hypothetical protein